MAGEVLSPKEIRACAPKGFRSAYERTAQNPAPPSLLEDLLGLVGYDVSAKVISEWCLLWRVQAEVWAVCEHVSASDNPVLRHPRPGFLSLPPWSGERVGEGAFEGPGPTRIGALR